MARTPIQRTGRQRRSVNQALRSLTGSGVQRYGFAVRTGTRQGAAPPSPTAVPAPPLDWPGTLPEWAVYWAHGAMGLVEGRDFIYLYQSYSIHDPQGIEIDFLEITHGMIGVQIQGDFWHYGFGGQKIESDAEQRVRIMGQGITPIYIDEDDANSDPLFYLREAIFNYRDYSLLSRGLA